MPSSWDILRTRRERMMVCVIAPPELRHSRQWSRMWGGLKLPAESQPFDVTGLPYDAARNIAVKRCLDEGFGYLLFVDSDCIPPVEAPLWLLETGRDLVGGNYCKRFPPFETVACDMQQDPKGVWVRKPLPPYRPGDVIPVRMLGMGFTLISRQCLQAVINKYPRPFQWGLDIAPVPDGFGGILPQISEDYLFCLRSAELGFQPYLATAIDIQHELMAVSFKGGIQMP